IGGTVAADRNVISGNVHNGISIFGAASTGNTVIGNFIGTDKSGTVRIGNLSGIAVESGASTVRIGGTTAGERNVISGNRSDDGSGGTGINIDGTSHDNLIEGNYIGTKVNGTEALPNADGIHIQGFNNTVGGSTGTVGGCSGTCNLISGNGTIVDGTSNAIDLDGTTAQNNLIIGNIVGLDNTGTTKVENLSNGVFFRGGASNNTIGGNTTQARNIFSGNRIAGIELSTFGGGTPSGNVIQGNYIGLNAAGTAIIRNSNGIF